MRWLVLALLLTAGCTAEQPPSTGLIPCPRERCIVYVAGP